MIVGPQIVSLPVIAPMVLNPDAGTTRLIAKTLSLTAPVILFFAINENHVLTPAVNPVAVKEVRLDCLQLLQIDLLLHLILPIHSA